MTFDVEAIRQHIPYYLTASPNEKVLLGQLKELAEGASKGYFIPPGNDGHTEDMLQGDGWGRFELYSFGSRNIKSVRGIILSNSCDISKENSRVLPVNVTFAPIIKLSRMIARLKEHGLDENKINSRVLGIREQRISNIFYLPSDGILDEDYIALLDDIHSMPINLHKTSERKLFTLSMAGFYIFLFKISVHFCRIQENIDRIQKTK